jgi:hypothetical protein
MAAPGTPETPAAPATDQMSQPAKEKGFFGKLIDRVTGNK